MSWVTPLGFLGLLAIGGLILIYILKPNYQQKVISSTYIWKLSLKYKKRRITTSRLRNILLIICQILILVSCALMLAQPIIETDKEIYKNEKIVIIDASASMMSSSNEVMRFSRAVSQVKELTTEVMEKENGKITVILAGKEAELLVRRATTENVTEVYKALDNLVRPGNFACTYGVSDVSGAIAMAEEVLVENGDAEVMLYTDTDYINDGNVTVKNVAASDEYNVAILNVTADLVDNFYSFNVEVASYNRDKSVRVKLTVSVPDNKGVTSVAQTYEAVVLCTNDEPQKIVFNTLNYQPQQPIYIFDKAIAEIVWDSGTDKDSLVIDDTFTLYGGKKHDLRIQYYSTKSNIYNDTGALSVMKVLSQRWDVEFKTVATGMAYEVEGFDLYIFEHKMPTTLPLDGVILLIDPDKAPDGTEMSVSSQKVTETSMLSSAKPHPVTAGLRSDIVQVSQYAKITSYNGYEELISCNDDPILLVKNQPNEKICVLTLDLNFSTFGVQEYALLMLNLINYYIPSTLTGHVFEVDQVISLNSRSREISLENATDTTFNRVFTEFPAEVVLSSYGSYTAKQTLLSGKEQIDEFYVKIAQSENNICRVDDTDVLLKLSAVSPVVIEDKDLVMYFAIALVALLFAEWLLQAKETM